MKDINVKVAVDFHPIEVRFTIESIEEFNELWVRLNLAHEEFLDPGFPWRRFSSKIRRKLPLNEEASLFLSLWYKLDAIIDEVNK